MYWMEMKLFKIFLKNDCKKRTNTNKIPKYYKLLKFAGKNKNVIL